MRKKIANLFLAFALFFPCLFMFSACENTDDIDLAKVKSIEVTLVEDSEYQMTDNTISLEYGSKVSFTKDDFVVTATFEDDTKKEIPLKTDVKEGYTITSTIPTEGITSVGDYKISIACGEKIKVDITVKVTKATINMSGVDWDYDSYFTYDTTDKEVKITGLPNGVTVEYEGTTKAKNVGVYNVTAIFSCSDNVNYTEIPDMSLTWEIKKATINVSSVSFEAKGYTGNVISMNEVPTNDLPEGVKIKNITGTKSGTDARDYEVLVEFEHEDVNERGNYDIPSVSATWTITPAKFTNIGTIELVSDDVTFDNNNNFVYNAKDRVVSVNSELNSNVRIKEVSGVSGTLSAKNVGRYTVTVDLEYIGTDTNYNRVDDVTLVWTISKATLTVMPKNASITYGDTINPNGYGYEVTGLLESDTSDVISGSAIYEYVNSGSKFDAGTYSIVFDDDSNLSASNYEINYSSTPGTLTINKKELTITADDVTITYGDELIPTVQYDGFVLGEDEESLDGELEFLIVSKTSSAMYSGNAGEYTITPDITNLTSQNYQILTPVSGSLIVNKKNISLVPNSVTIPYGTEKSAIVYNGVSITGDLASGDSVADLNLTFDTNYTTGDDAGTYNITITAPENDNYNITCNNGENLLTVSKVNVDVSSIALNYTEIEYQGTDVSSLINYVENTCPSNVVVLDMVINNNEPAIDVGEYSVILSLACTDVGNFNAIPDLRLYFEIIPKEVDLSSVALSKNDFTYRGEAIDITSYVTYPNYLKLLNITNNNNINTNDDSYVSTVTFELKDTKNYKLTETSKELSYKISKATLTIIAVSYEIEYGDDVEDREYTVVGLVEGEDESVITGNAVLRYENSHGIYTVGSDAGEYSIVFTNETTLSADNYTIELISGVLTVSPKAIEITPNNIEVPYGTDKNNLDYSIVDIDLAGDDTTNDLQLEYNTDYNTNDNVGEYTITVTATNDNYSIKYNEGVLNVVPADIVVDGIVGLIKNTFEYTGSDIIPQIDQSTIPHSDFVTASLSIKGNAETTEIGDYVAIITFVVDNDNYNDIDPIELDFHIVRAEVDLESVVSLSKSDFAYRGTSIDITDYIIYPEYLSIVNNIVNNNKINADDYIATVTFELNDTTHYILTEDSVNLPYTISKVTLTITAVSYEIEYGDDVEDRGYTVVGLVDGEDESVITGNAVLRYENSYGIYTVGSDAGEYSIVFTNETILSADNYTIELIPGVLTVSPKTVVIIPNDIEIEYGTDKSTIQFSAFTDVALVGDDTIESLNVEFSTEYVTGDNVGSYLISVTKPENKNYNFMCNNGFITVTPAHADFSGVQLENNVIPYTGSNVVLNVNEDTLPNISLSLITVDVKNVEEAIELGSYTAVVTFTINDSNYYETETIELPFTIVVADIDLSNVVLLESEFTYTGYNINVIDYLEMPSYLSTDTVVNNKNVNEYTVIITFTCTDSEHYNLTETTKEFSFSITKAPLNVIANDYSITYGDDPITDGYEYRVDGLLGEDTVNVIIGEAVFTHEYQMPNGCGEYDIYVDGLTADNYEIIFTPGTLTVEKKDLYIIFTDIVITYGEEPYLDSQPDLNGFVFADTKDEVLIVDENGGFYFEGYDFEGDNGVGTYPICVEGISADNYNIVVSGNLIINPVEIDAEIFNWPTKTKYGISIDTVKPELISSHDFVEVTYKYYSVNDLTTEIDPVEEGDYVAYAILEVTNDNYTIIGEVSEFYYSIGKEGIDLSLVTWGDVNKFGVSLLGEAIKPTLQNLPEGVNVTYTYTTELGTPADCIEVGNYIAKAEITLENPDLYELDNNNIQDFEYSIVLNSIDESKLTWSIPTIFNSEAGVFTGFVEYTGSEVTPRLINNTGFDLNIEYLEGQGVLSGTERAEYITYVHVSLVSFDENYFAEDFDRTYTLNWTIDYNPFISIRVNGEEYQFVELLNNQYYKIDTTFEFVLKDGYNMSGYSGYYENNTYSVTLDDYYKPVYIDIHNSEGYYKNFTLTANLMDEILFEGVKLENVNLNCSQFINIDLAENDKYLTIDFDEKYLQEFYRIYVMIDNNDMVTITSVPFELEITERCAVYFYIATNEYGSSCVLGVGVTPFSVISHVVFTTFNIANLSETTTVPVNQTILLSGTYTFASNTLISNVKVLFKEGYAGKYKFFYDDNMKSEITSFYNINDITSFVIAVYTGTDVYVEKLPVSLRFIINDDNYDYPVSMMIGDNEIAKYYTNSDTFALTYIPTAYASYVVTYTANGDTTFNSVTLTDIITYVTCAIRITYTVDDEQFVYIVNADLEVFKCSDPNTVVSSISGSSDYIQANTNEINVANRYSLLNISQMNLYDIVITPSPLYQEVSDTRTLVRINDDYYLKITLEPATLSGMSSYIYTYIKMVVNGNVDSNVSANIYFTNGVTGETTYINDNSTPIDVVDTSMQSLTILPNNSYALVEIKNGEGLVVNNNINADIYHFIFPTGGDYTLVITATDGITTITYNFTVEEPKTLLKVTITNDNNDEIVYTMENTNDRNSDFIPIEHGPDLYVNMLDDFSTIPDTITISKFESSLSKDTKLYRDSNHEVEIDFSQPFTLDVDKTYSVPCAMVYTSNESFICFCFGEYQSGSGGEPEYPEYPENPEYPGDSGDIDTSSVNVEIESIDIFDKNEYIEIIDDVVTIENCHSSIAYDFIGVHENAQLRLCSTMPTKDTNIDEITLKYSVGPFRYVFQSEGIYYLFVISADGEHGRMITINVSGDFDPLFSFTLDSVGYSLAFDESNNFTSSTAKYTFDMTSGGEYYIYDGYITDFLGASALNNVADDNTLTLTSLTSSYYNIYLNKEKDSIGDGTFEVLTDEFGQKYIRFYMLGTANVYVTPQDGVSEGYEDFIDSWVIVTLYLMDAKDYKDDYPLKITVGKYSFDFKYDLTEMLNHGPEVMFDDYEGMSYISLTLDQIGLTEENLTADIAFQLSKDFSDDSYLVFTDEAMSGEYNTFDEIIAAGLGFKASTTKVILEDVDFSNGYIFFAISHEGFAGDETKADMYTFIPLMIVVDDCSGDSSMGPNEG